MPLPALSFGFLGFRRFLASQPTLLAQFLLPGHARRFLCLALLLLVERYVVQHPAHGVLSAHGFKLFASSCCFQLRHLAHLFCNQRLVLLVDLESICTSLVYPAMLCCVATHPSYLVHHGLDLVARIGLEFLGEQVTAHGTREVPNNTRHTRHKLLTRTTGCVCPCGSICARSCGSS